MNASKEMLCKHLRYDIWFLVLFLVVSTFNVINYYANQVVIVLTN